MKYAYYPGCSLETTSQEFARSFEVVFNRLELHLEEIEDWCCCGSTPAHMASKLLAVALPTQNMLWAQDRSLDIVAPCAACFSALKMAQYTLDNDTAIRKQVSELLGREPRITVRIRHALDPTVNDVGLEELKKQVKIPLKELGVASYYGCLLNRPPKVKQFEDPENPVLLDRLVEAIGAEPVDWTHKSICCGALFSLVSPGVAERMSNEILRQARKAGAKAIVVACPLCHINLDLAQSDIEKRYGESYGIPVFYFSQILGVALGIDLEELSLHKNIVPPWDVLRPFIGKEEYEKWSG